MSECPACKVIINGGFVAIAADLYHDVSRSDAAGHLASTAAAANSVFAWAMEMHVIPLPKFSEWRGCDEAKEIMEWVAFDSEAAPPKDVAAERDEKMYLWARMFSDAVFDIVRGGHDQHKHK